MGRKGDFFILYVFGHTLFSIIVRKFLKMFIIGEANYLKESYLDRPILNSRVKLLNL